MGTNGPRGDAVDMSDAVGAVPDSVWQYLALGVAVVVGFALLNQSLVFGVAALALLLAVVTVVSAVEIVDAYRSEEHTSELQSPLIISYAVFCLRSEERRVGKECRL